MTRNCDNCKHYGRGLDEWPCRCCGFERGNGPFDKWEPVAAQSKPAEPSPASVCGWPDCSCATANCHDAPVGAREVEPSAPPESSNDL